MSLERIRHLVDHWERAVRDAAPGPAAPLPEGLDAATARGLLESMLLARQLDVAAHELRARGAGHYTICSSGHEANVVLGALTTPRDPALLHYRSAALVLERARHASSYDPVREIALSLVASSEESTSGGRHKVFGSRALGIIPKTSTIASHLPRAVGIGFGIDRRERLGLRNDTLPLDAASVAVASFGDASINHSTALGALNAAGWVTHQNLALPVLFVCEDNGLGISVRSPTGWVETRLRAMPHLRYFSASGLGILDAWRSARDAIQHVRTTRRPAVLHLTCVRLLGHAGSDVDTTYRTPAEVEDLVNRDPVLLATTELLAAGAISSDEALALGAAARDRVSREAERAQARPRLESRSAVASALALDPPAQAPAPTTVAAPPAEGGALTLAQGITQALADALASMPEVLVFGEDVAKKGGVYGLTKGLLKQAGPARVFNTLLDEQTILGLALGTSLVGFLPVPEIQYLAYLHNAEDQLRGEASTMRFFSDGAYDNPMVVRIASFAYQTGFGGHFHNDTSVAVLRDVPGVVVGVPARGDDAIEMLRTAFALAGRSRRVVVLLEPIALYHTRDLHDPGDGGWLAPAPSGAAPFGRARVYGSGADLTLASYGNGLFMSLRVARTLEERHGIRARVLDLRWLVPLPMGDLIHHANATGRLLVVDECRRSGSPSEEILARLAEASVQAKVARVTSADSFVPLGEAANLVLVSEAEILDAALRATT